MINVNELRTKQLPFGDFVTNNLVIGSVRFELLYTDVWIDWCT